MFGYIYSFFKYSVILPLLVLDTIHCSHTFFYSLYFFVLQQFNVFTNNFIFFNYFCIFKFLNNNCQNLQNLYNATFFALSRNVNNMLQYLRVLDDAWTKRDVTQTNILSMVFW